MTANSADPWIVTSHRIPYLVFSVALPADLSASELEAALLAKAKRVSDVYNCKAFSLSEDNSVIACIRNKAECAIITFTRHPIALGGDEVSRDPLVRPALDGLKRLNELLASESKHSQLKIQCLAGQEISRVIA